MNVPLLCAQISEANTRQFAEIAIAFFERLCELGHPAAEAIQAQLETDMTNACEEGLRLLEDVIAR